MNDDDEALLLETIGFSHDTEASPEARQAVLDHQARFEQVRTR